MIRIARNWAWVAGYAPNIVDHITVPAFNFNSINSPDKCSSNFLTIEVKTRPDNKYLPGLQVVSGSFDIADHVRYIPYAEIMDAWRRPEVGCVSWTFGWIEIKDRKKDTKKLKLKKNLFNPHPDFYEKFEEKKYQKVILIYFISFEFYWYWCILFRIRSSKHCNVSTAAYQEYDNMELVIVKNTAILYLKVSHS